MAGVKSSASLCSLIEMAKANALEPHAYLREVFVRLLQVKTLVEMEQLLLWRAAAVSAGTI